MDTTILNKIYKYFHNNESTKQYLQIISIALDRQKPIQDIIDKYCLRTITKKKKEHFDIYTEMHHIIPRSLDKELENYKPNWVILTGEEHFIVHKLLVDMCISKRHYHSMCEAYCHMSFHNRGWEVTPEEYAIAKKLHAEATSLRMKRRIVSEEIRFKIKKSLTGVKHTQERIKNRSEAMKGKPNLALSEPIECYIIVEGKEIIIDTFISSASATEKTNGCQSGILKSANDKGYSSGVYNTQTKQYNEKRFSSSSVLPNDKYPNTYRLYWKKKGDDSSIIIKVPEKIIECYIIVNKQEVLLDSFISPYDAADKTNGCQSQIVKAAIGKVNSSGAYNIDTKQYNERKFSGHSLPNDKYLTTYKLYWRKIK